VVSYRKVLNADEEPCYIDIKGSDLLNDLGMVVVANEQESGTQIGPITTTAGDVDAFDGGWNVLGYKQCTLILNNTHATYGLIYTIIGYPGEITGNGKTLFTDTLPALTQEDFVIENRYNKIVCNCKTASGTNHATYTLDFCGGP
jgi:hypothetical protein